MVLAKMMALQRYSLKLQINRTPVLSDRQNAVLHSSWCYAIFAWYDYNMAMYDGDGALGNWLFVIHTCASLFSPTLLPLDLHAFVYAFGVWLVFDLFWITFFATVFFVCVLNSDVFFFYLFLNVCLYSLKWQMMWTISKSHNGANEKKNQIKIESNKIKIDSNTKNVNVITFSFTSILWINVTAIHFPFVSFCYCRVVLCWIKRCIEQKKNTFKSNGAHVIS